MATEAPGRSNGNGRWGAPLGAGPAGQQGPLAGGLPAHLVNPPVRLAPGVFPLPSVPPVGSVPKIDALPSNAQYTSEASKMGDTLGYGNSGVEFCFDTRDLQSGARELINRVQQEEGCLYSDDTIFSDMTRHTLDLILERYGSNAPVDVIVNALICVYTTYQQDPLWRSRGHGQTMEMSLSQLQDRLAQGQPPIRQGQYNPREGGCGAAMRTMAIGERFYRKEDEKRLIEIALKSSYATHTHPMGFLGGLASALFTAFAYRDLPIHSWIPELLAITNKPNGEAYKIAVGTIRDSLSEPNKVAFDQAWDDFNLVYDSYYRFRFNKGSGIQVSDLQNEHQFARQMLADTPEMRDQFWTQFAFISGGNYSHLREGGQLRRDLTIGRPGHVWPGSSGHDAALISYDSLLLSMHAFCQRSEDIQQHEFGPDLAEMMLTPSGYQTLVMIGDPATQQTLFEDLVRRACLFGGDSDSTGAIAFYVQAAMIGEYAVPAQCRPRYPEPSFFNADQIKGTVLSLCAPEIRPNLPPSLIEQARQLTGLFARVTQTLAGPVEVQQPTGRVALVNAVERDPTILNDVEKLLRDGFKRHLDASQTINNQLGRIACSSVLCAPRTDGLVIRFSGANSPAKEIFYRNIKNSLQSCGLRSEQCFQTSVITDQEEIIVPHDKAIEFLTSFAGLTEGEKSTVRASYSRSLAVTYRPVTLKSTSDGFFRPATSIAASLMSLTSRGKTVLNDCGYPNNQFITPEKNNFFPFLEMKPEGLLIRIPSEGDKGVEIRAVLEKTFGLTFTDVPPPQNVPPGDSRREYRTGCVVPRCAMLSFLKILGFEQGQPDSPSCITHLMELDQYHFYDVDMVGGGANARISNPVSVISKALEILMPNPNDVKVTAVLHPTSEQLNIKFSSPTDRFVTSLISYINLNANPPIIERKGTDFTVKKEAISSLLKRLEFKNIPEWEAQLLDLNPGKGYQPLHGISQAKEARVYNSVGRSLLMFASPEIKAQLLRFTAVENPEYELPLPFVSKTPTGDLSILLPADLIEVQVNGLFFRKYLETVFNLPGAFCRVERYGRAYNYEITVPSTRVRSFLERDLLLRELPEEATQSRKSGRRTFYHEFDFDVSPMTWAEERKPGEISRKPAALALRNLPLSFDGVDLNSITQDKMKNIATSLLRQHPEAEAILDVLDRIYNLSSPRTNAILSYMHDLLRLVMHTLQKPEISPDRKRSILEEIRASCDPRQTCNPGILMKLQFEYLRLANPQGADIVRSSLLTEVGTFKNGIIAEMANESVQRNELHPGYHVHAVAAANFYWTEYGLSPEEARHDTYISSEPVRRWAMANKRRFAEIYFKGANDLIDRTLMNINEQLKTQQSSITYYREKLISALEDQGFQEPEISERMDELLPMDEDSGMYGLSRDAVILLLTDLGILNP